MAFDNFFRANRFSDSTVTGSNGRDLITGYFGDDRLFGGGGNDMIRAGFGNDYIEGGAGSDFIDGGFGVDTAGYLGNFADYQIQIGPFTRVTNAAGEVDTLRNIEVLQFADRTIYLDGRDNGPVAEDDAAAVDADATLVLDAATLLANDSDFDGDTLAVTGVGTAGQGTVEFIDGQVRYVPGAAFATLPAGETATDSFTYTVEANGVTTTATVTVTVTGTYVPEPVAALISEIRPNPPGSDPSTQTVELSGTPGETFTGWLLSVESDNDSGVIDRASEITGTFDENGLLTAEIGDLENPSFTLILTDSFTGSVGDTILPNGATTPDTSALGTIFDAVGVPDRVGDPTLGAALGGIDMPGGPEPELIFREGSTGDFFAVRPDGTVLDASGNEVDAESFSSDPTDATFGGVNPTREAAPVAALISEIRPNPQGSDPSTQTVELSGTPGQVFDGWLLSVESDFAGGIIDRATNIQGTFDENGLLTAEIGDLENPSFTLILTDSFTGSVGDQIDPDQDGTPEALDALGNILDVVGVLDSPNDVADSVALALGGVQLISTNEPELIFREGSTGDFFSVLGTGTVLDAAGNEVDAESFDADPRDATFGGVNPSQASAPLTLTINEILADPASGADGDANGDGARSAIQDEFVEIVNTGTSAADLSGLTLSDAAQLRHVFAEGTVLEPNEAIVVFGGGAPTGDFGGAQVVTASTGTLGLSNSGDTVTLANDGEVVDQVSYGREGGDNTSLTRIPDLTGDFAKHTEAGGRFSPGTTVGGDSFGEPTSGGDTTLISQVQGSGQASGMVGETVTIEAIVVGDFQGNRDSAADGGKDDDDVKRSLNGFFVQEEASDHDGDASTSEGLFIYDPALLTDVALGDKVRITGRVNEYYGMTQITAASVEITQAGAVEDVKTMAVSVEIDPIDAVQVSNDTYSVDLEAVEGMIATFPETLTVIEAYNLDRFNEVRLTAGERPQQFTQANEPSTEGYTPYLETVFSDVITFDDGLSVQNAPIFDEADINDDGVFNAADGFGMGDTITGLTGVVQYSFNTFRVRSVEDGNRFEDTQTRDATPPITSTDGDGKLSITSFNVLNFFSTLDQNGNTAGPNGLEPRGADNPEEYARQLDKLLTTLTTIDSDLYGLVELENDFSQDGDTAIKAVVEGLNASYGEGVWDWVYPGRDFVDTGDAISVGIIYKTSEITYTEGSAAVLDDAGVAALGLTPPYQLFDGPSTNRAPLVASFTENTSGEAFSVAVAHMKSKGSVNPNGSNADAGDGAGNNDEIRTLGTEALTEWLKPENGVAEDRQLVLGDFNAYAKENPIEAMKAGGYVNLEETLGGDADTFVFNGQTGTLDYAFASEDMAGFVTQAAAWEINSNEPDAIDYNTDFGRDPAIFDGSEPYRSSDHDPLTVEIMLGDALV